MTRPALLIAITSAVAGGACGGKARPAAVGNTGAGGGGNDLTAALVRDVGGGVPVAIVPGADGLRAVSADGKRQRTLAPGPVRWALLDDISDVVWFADGDTGAVKLIDLEGPPADPPVVVTVATGLPDSSDAGPPMIAIEYQADNPPPPTVDLQLGSALTPKIAIVVSPQPGLDAVGGILEQWDTADAFRTEVQKGRIAARDLVVALYQRSKRPSHGKSYDIDPAPHRLDTIDKSNCEDEQECGAAEVVMGTKLWRVAVSFSCGDGCYTEWQLYDPTTQKFLDGDWARWLNDAEEASDGSAFVANGVIVRFDSGPLPATPSGEMIGGGWLGGGYHYGM